MIRIKTTFRLPNFCEQATPQAHLWSQPRLCLPDESAEVPDEVVELGVGDGAVAELGEVAPHVPLGELQLRHRGGGGGDCGGHCDTKLTRWKPSNGRAAEATGHNWPHWCGGKRSEVVKRSKSLVPNPDPVRKARFFEQKILLKNRNYYRKIPDPNEDEIV